MSEHNYTRVKKTGGWDINNVDHQNDDGSQIFLATEIKAAIPDKAFTVRCDGVDCIVDFVDQLSGPEIAILNGVVAAHKAIVTTVIADRATLAVERTALRDSWDALKASHPYITGPFEHKLQEVNLMLDEGRNAEAEAVIEFADPPSGYDAAQLTVFNAVKAQMLTGLQGLTIP